MDTSSEKIRVIEDKINLLQQKLNMPPLGKYTIPEDIKRRLDENCFERGNVIMLVNSMMSHMRLPFEQIDLRINVDRSPDRNIRYRPSGEYVFYGVPGRNQIGITLTPEDNAESVAAILSHEMSHHYLYHNWIVTKPELDNEIFTDVAGVYFGFAVYMLGRYAENVKQNLSARELFARRNTPNTIGYIDREQIKYAMRRCDEIRRAYRNAGK